ncbi:hypothetical protein QQ73_03665 [Candidatus Endoriftia persephone str. Guaymas]|nr:hypothetical protein [Candidatus Endoriftia persephone str. Guaymas]
MARHDTFCPDVRKQQSRPGLFRVTTNMPSYQTLFTYFSLSWALIAIALLLIAWRAVRAGKIRLHRNLMMTVTAGAWLFVALYLLRYRYPELKAEVPPEYVGWIAFHGSVALLPLIGAALLIAARLLAGPDSHFNRHHRRYGRLLIPLWLFTHLGGLVNIYLFYPTS